MTREAGLWRWLRGARGVLRDDLHMRRLENSAGSGVPDVEGELRGGGQFWIELKSAPRPGGGGPVRFKVRDSQVEWMRRRSGIGNGAWFLLQVGSGHEAGRYMIPGRHAVEVQAGVTEHWLHGHCGLGVYPGYDGAYPCHRPAPEDMVRCAAGSWG